MKTLPAILGLGAKALLLSATIVASPALVEGQISLRVVADPAGPDQANLNGEIVTVTNRQTVPLDLSGWSLCDAVGACFRFDEETSVGPGGSIRVRTGSGRDTPRDVYMGRRTPLWDNWADIATLRDDEGVIRSRCVWDRGRGLDCPGQARSFQPDTFAAWMRMNSGYSYRSASIGSSAAAFRAG